MIEDNALLNFLQREEARSVDTTLNQERKTALEMYRGDPFGDEVDGRSKLRTRDVAEVVDYMLASILRTLVSGDKVVEFEPSNPGEDDIAQQITDRIHWNFLREQDGFAVLRDGIKAGLLEKSGVWKSWVERPKVPQVQRINVVQLERLGGDVRDARIAEDLYDLDEMTGEPLAVYDAQVMVPGPPQFKDAAIPNDEFFVAPDARTLDTAIYLGNISRVSLADLMEMGYAYEDIENLWGDDGQAQELRDARDEGRSEKENDTNRTDLARMVTLREEYARYVWNGSYQLVRVHRVHTTILSVEAAENQPYTLWCPFPMQHRLIGHSLADKTMDIQVVRSHMLRQAMDALYIANAPRVYVDMGQADETTLDDVLDVAPGGVIRGKGPNAVVPFQQPFAAPNAFEAMQIMSGEKESRTGITRLNQGLDADALNKTATGTALMQASGQQMEELVAREAANAVGEMFEKKLRLMTEHMEPHEFRTDGKVVQMQPQTWPRDLRLAVRVGLGSGNKDRKLQALGILKQTMAEAIQVDPRLVTADKVFEAAKLTTSTLGLGPATQYFNDPAQLPPQEPQPDPEVIKAQTEAQLQAQKQQGEQAMQAAKLQGEQQIAAFKLQAQRESDAASVQAMREKAVAEQQLAREKAQFEAELAIEKMNREFALEQERMNRQHALSMQQAAQEAEFQRNRPGGRLDA